MGKVLHQVQIHSASKQNVDANTTHTQGMHIRQFVVANVFVYYRDPSQLVLMTLQHFEHVPVVGAIDARLHQNPSLHPHRPQHLQIQRLRCRRRGVATVGYQWIALKIAGDYVCMGVACPGRHYEARGPDLCSRGRAQRRRVGGGSQVRHGFHPLDSLSRVITVEKRHLLVVGCWLSYKCWHVEFLPLPCQCVQAWFFTRGWGVSSGCLVEIAQPPAEPAQAERGIEQRRRAKRRPASVLKLGR